MAILNLLMNSLGLVLLLNVINAQDSIYECPSSSTIAPCTCDHHLLSASLNCGGNNEIDLKQVFQRLSNEIASTKDKFYSNIFISNTWISELQPGVFADIYFRSIYINGAKNLTKIHRDAFNMNKDHTVSLEITGTPIAETLDPEYNIYPTLSAFKNLYFLTLGQTELKNIPDEAFITLDKLRTIAMTKGLIQSVGKNIVKNSQILQKLDLSHNRIDRISENAFTLIGKTETFNEATIDLSSNNLNDISISRLVLNGTKGAVTFNLDNNYLSHIDEQVFSYFLAQNPGNKVQFTELDCYNCKNQWLIKSFPKQLNLVKCKNHAELTDKNNFADC